MKTKIFTHLVLGVLFFATQTSHAQNILLDGNFETTTEIISYSSGTAPANSWNSFKNSGVEANATVVDGVCDYQLTNAGIDAWEVQLEQAGFPLVSGDYYRLTFDVRADADRWFGLYLGEYGGSWTSLIGYENYWQSATTSWKTISIDFQVKAVFDYHKFSCEIGGNNVSMYFDNIILEDLGPYASVGIIGTAVNGGWDVDVDMITTDGINYTLSNFPITRGQAKFRESNSWSINWGNNTFPTGYAYFYGPNIPIPGYGNYDISFNRETGEYSFTCVSNCTAAIGIMGSAVPPNYDFGPDVNMLTDDGTNYFLKSYAFADGEARFRKDDSWDVNWGNSDFRVGTATLGGPSIPVTAGVYNVTFNLNTLDYSFKTPVIGILGSALAGWDTDIEMQTSDGLNFTLSDYPFADGAVKFRSDNSWDVSWGGYGFPSGWAFSDGPDIYVMAGNYNVTFNLMTGEYKFTATSCPNPNIQCPYTIYAGNSPGSCSAIVYYPEVVAAPNCGGDGISIKQTAGLPSGSLFPLGITTNTFELTNASGNTSTCSFDVMVFDTEAPVIGNITTDFEKAKKPNRKMILVTVKYDVSDNCSNKTTSQLIVFVNDSLYGGNTTPNWIVLDEHHFLVRDEHEKKGAGREYYVNIQSHDESWNFTFQQFVVTIPHDNRDSEKDSERNENEHLSKSKTTIPSLAFDTENLPVRINVWPNPSAHDFNLEVETSDDKSIELSISDMNGGLLSNQKILNKHSIRFGDDLKPGIYLVSVRQGDYFNTVKVVKQ